MTQHFLNQYKIKKILIAIGKDGSVGCSSIIGSEGNQPEAAYWSKKGFKVIKGTYLIDGKKSAN